MRRAAQLSLPDDPEQFQQAQTRLASAVRCVASDVQPQTWGAVDVAYSITGPPRAFGVAVVMHAVEGTVLEVATWEGPPPYDYIPGLFALREGACLIATLERLQQRPDILFVDGQGIAHPRGFGLACQIGLTFDIPTVGVAKRRLFGEYVAPGDAAGDWSPLRHPDQPSMVFGAVLRTCSGVKPVFVSPGHHCDVETAVRWSIAARSPYRILAPIREADIRTRQLRDGHA